MEVGAYVTDGRRLLQVLGCPPSPRRQRLELEDCATLEVVAARPRDLRRLRIVRPAGPPAAPTPAAPREGSDRERVGAVRLPLL
jgi:hypothetical protein